MKNKLPRICFIGCGNIALKHSRLLKKLYPDIELSFATRNVSKSKKNIGKFTGKNYFNSYEEALESNNFDIAFITTPHAFHSELAVLAANNKKHLIIEKPVARNMKEFLDIEKAVQKNGVRCVVAENYFYKSFIKKIREYIHNGLIGDVLFVELNKTNRDNISGWRTDADMMGGGALLEGGVHWINALVSIAGSDPVETIAIKPGVQYDSNIPFEDSIILFINFKNGIAGKLLHSWRIPNPLKGMGISKIYGTEGIITFESNGLFVSLHGKKKRFFITNLFDFLGYKKMHKEFIEAFISDREWQPSMNNIKTELKVIESAYKSLSSKKIERIL